MDKQANRTHTGKQGPNLVLVRPKDRTHSHTSGLKVWAGNMNTTLRFEETLRRYLQKDRMQVRHDTRRKSMLQTAVQAVGPIHATIKEYVHAGRTKRIGPNVRGQNGEGTHRQTQRR